MHAPLHQILEIRHASCVSAARSAAQAAAATLGFAQEACQEIAIVMTELATNLIKHARGGTLTMMSLSEKARVGLQIESLDHGPGFIDIEQALTDRFSTAGSRGTGLGAVNRLMDELNIRSSRGEGAQIVCRKWIRAHRQSTRACPLDVGVATRPRRINEPNGDAFVVKRWAESVLVAVIDGLGHGQFAHHAAQAARHYVEGHYDMPLDLIFKGAGRACRATRGVVMALARFDWGSGLLAFGALGNIEARVFSASAPFRFAMRRGVIGMSTSHVPVTETPWPADNILVLHSDGLHSRWDWKDFPCAAEQPAQHLAQDLLRSQSNEDDDATVIVVRNMIP